MPIIDDFHTGDWQQKPHTGPRLREVGGGFRLGAGDEIGAVITAARITPMAADDVAAVDAPKSSHVEQ
jgi:hypothetical protein